MLEPLNTPECLACGAKIGEGHECLNGQTLDGTGILRVCWDCYKQMSIAERLEAQRRWRLYRLVETDFNENGGPIAGFSELFNPSDN